MSQASERAKRFAISGFAGLGAAITAAVAWASVVFVVTVAGRSTASWVIVTWTLSALLVPLVTGLIVARHFYVRGTNRVQLAPLRTDATAASGARRVGVRRTVLAVVVGMYVVTWAAGVPAVQTSLTRDVLQATAELRSSGRQAYEVPRIKVLVSFPVLPGVLLTYHERQVAGMNGWGGWLLHAWGPTGVRELFRVTVWVS